MHVAQVQTFARRVSCAVKKVFAMVLGIVGASEVLDSLAETFPGTEKPDFVKWNETAVEKTEHIQDQLLDKLQQLEVDAAVACAKQEAQRRGTGVNDAIAGAQVLVNASHQGRKSKSQRSKTANSLVKAFETAANQLAHAKQPAAE